MPSLRVTAPTPESAIASLLDFDLSILPSDRLLHLNFQTLTTESQPFSSSNHYQRIDDTKFLCF
jgi:hypothetical protein